MSSAIPFLSAFRLVPLLCFIVLAPVSSRAFSLLGPYASWQVPALGYRLNGQIGGPMTLNEGYRWNVPAITYGFDPSFIGYFGTNGVVAIEEAFKILNDLPPFSEITVVAN